MKSSKFKVGKIPDTYIVDAQITELEILSMALKLAKKRLNKGLSLEAPQQVFSHLQIILQDYEHEVFALLMLDNKNRIIEFYELFRGTLDGAKVYPREVVKTALKYNAAAVIFVHNHPSGDPEPSQTDRALTLSLKNALNLIGTRTLDHIVVGSEGCISLAERGYL